MSTTAMLWAACVVIATEVTLLDSQTAHDVAEGLVRTTSRYETVLMYNSGETRPTQNASCLLYCQWFFYSTVHNNTKQLLILEMNMKSYSFKLNALKKC